jgi:hypothetical protein
MRIRRLAAALVLVVAAAGAAQAQTFREGLEHLSPDGGTLRSVELAIGASSLTVTGVPPAPGLPLTLPYTSLGRLAYEQRTTGVVVRHVLRLEFTRDGGKGVGTLLIGMPAELAPRLVSSLEARTGRTAVRTRS